MIECKFSLNLSKNGVQKTVYAKAGESNARMLIITLSHNGKVYELEGHSAMVFLESGENFLADIVDNTVQAVIPNAFPEPQIRVCELRISKGDKVIYTPMFEIVFEVSLGNIAETESLVDGVQYIIKAEHDREDSHSISMVANLRDELDSKASDAVLDAYVKKTDGAITNLNSDVNLLKETSHSHSNKSALDLISDVGGEFHYNGKAVSGMSDFQNTQLKEAYEKRHSHFDINGSDNLYVLEGFSENESFRPLYHNKPLAFHDEIPFKTSHLENDSGFITKDDLPESGSGNGVIERKTETVTFTQDDMDYMFTSEHPLALVDIWWLCFVGESSTIVCDSGATIELDGIEIADIEVACPEIAYGEYVSTKHMFQYGEDPYISMVNKVYNDSSRGYVLAAYAFFGGLNDIAIAADNFDWSSARITFYVD